MTQPWPTEAEFSIEHLQATRAQKAGVDSLMNTLMARMEVLEAAGKEFYPGSPTGIRFDSFSRSESLTDWADREEEARTPVRFDERLCGCRIGFNSAGDPVQVDPQCGPLRRCRDLDWRRRHVLEKVELEDADGQRLWS